MGEPSFELTVISKDLQAVRLAIPVAEAYGLLHNLEAAIAEYESDVSREHGRGEVNTRGDERC